MRNIHESGRSILEMVAIIVLMILLISLGLWGFQKAVLSARINTMTKDMTTAITEKRYLVAQKGIKANSPEEAETLKTKKVGNTEMIIQDKVDESGKGYFSVLLSNLNKEICEEMKRYNVFSPEKIVINEIEGGECTQINNIEFYFDGSRVGRRREDGNQNEFDPLTSRCDGITCGECKKCNPVTGLCENDNTITKGECGKCMGGRMVPDTNVLAPCEKCNEITWKIEKKNTGDRCGTCGQCQADGTCLSKQITDPSKKMFDSDFPDCCTAVYSYCPLDGGAPTVCESSKTEEVSEEDGCYTYTKDKCTGNPVGTGSNAPVGTHCGECGLCNGSGVCDHYDMEPVGEMTGFCCKPSSTQKYCPKYGSNPGCTANQISTDYPIIENDGCKKYKNDLCKNEKVETEFLNEPDTTACDGVCGKCNGSGSCSVESELEVTVLNGHCCDGSKKQTYCPATTPNPGCTTDDWSDPVVSEDEGCAKTSIRTNLCDTTKTETTYPNNGQSCGECGDGICSNGTCSGGAKQLFNGSYKVDGGNCSQVNGNYCPSQMEECPLTQCIKLYKNKASNKKGQGDVVVECCEDTHTLTSSGTNLGQNEKGYQSGSNTTEGCCPNDRTYTTTNNNKFCCRSNQKSTGTKCCDIDKAYYKGNEIKCCSNRNYIIGSAETKEQDCCIPDESRQCGTNTTCCPNTQACTTKGICCPVGQSDDGKGVCTDCPHLFQNKASDKNGQGQDLGACCGDKSLTINKTKNTLFYGYLGGTDIQYGCSENEHVYNDSGIKKSCAGIIYSNGTKCCASSDNLKDDKCLTRTCYSYSGDHNYEYVYKTFTVPEGVDMITLKAIFTGGSSAEHNQYYNIFKNSKQYSKGKSKSLRSDETDSKTWNISVTQGDILKLGWTSNSSSATASYCLSYYY